MSEIICTVDVVLLTIKNDSLMVAVHRRDHAPCQGELALPGGYVHTETDGSAFDAAMRVIRSKTGITPPYLEQLLTFAGPDRDPRGWSLSIAHYALVPVELIEQANKADVRLL
jgi:8-oxo-dGTP diphosphatase